MSEQTPRTDCVICPACAYQFWAISQDHQAEFAAAQAQIAALQYDIERHVQIAAAQANEIVALQRGEYICRKCGLRKDGEHEKGDF